MSRSDQTQEFQAAVLDTNIDTDWSYLSEGNKHIVFRSTKTNGILKSLVLNINKDPHESEDTFASNYIAQKWLGENYVTHTIHPIHLPHSFVIKLINKIQDQRPLKRKKKHPFETKETESKTNQNEHASAIDVLYTASLEDNASSLHTNINSKNKSSKCCISNISRTDDDRDYFEMPSPKRRKRNGNSTRHRDNDSDESSSSPSQSPRQPDTDQEYKRNEDHTHHDMIEGVLTFDMKPKWMFLNMSPFIDDNNIKKSVCRFGMHQQLKFNVTKSVHSVSKYCPLSLLSNDVNIIASNIKFLMEANQTNFKVFHRREEIKSYELIKEHHIDTVASIIVEHNELFKKISMLQRLDKFDIEIIYKIWNELKTRNKLEMIDEIMKDTKILDEIINELNVEFNKTKFDKEKSCICQNMDKIKQCITNHKEDKEIEANEFIQKSTNKQLLIYICQYLISSIFKDCQVLITIDFNNCDNHKITVIDLHSKPMDRIENKWLKQDREIVQNYIHIMTQ